jgi:RHS repeat-associated protein
LPFASLADDLESCPSLRVKSDYSAGATTDYTYGATGSGCGPHAASSVNLAGSGVVNYTCDTNGNVIGGTSATSLNLVYDGDNHPWQGSRGGSGTDTWTYSPIGQLDYETSSRGNRYYGPMGYEQVGAQQIHELGPVVVTRNGTVDTVSVVLRDRLGSTVNVIDNNSPTLRSYDAFGKPIMGNGNLLSPPALGLTDTLHGFTKHEHDDDVLLINTVGRLYDFQLGRFLQVDPIIGNPSNSRSLNPYSYIGNNPLSGTDPTGYACVGSHIQSQTCADTGATWTQMGSPSKSEEASNQARALYSKFAAIFNASVSRNAGNDSTTSSGALSTPNTAQGSIGALNQTTGSRPVQTMGTISITGISPESWEDYRQVYPGYLNEWSVRYSDWYAREASRQMARGLGKEFLVKQPLYVLGGIATGGVFDYLLANAELAGSIGAIGGFSFETGAVGAGAAGAGGAGGAVGAAADITDITLSASRYPQSAQHIREAQAAGQPDVLTIDRGGAAARRSESLRGTPSRAGSDRDEYPPAMFQEGGRGSSIRYINPSDNRGAGACIGGQCRGLDDGARVRINVDDH